MRPNRVLCGIRLSLHNPWEVHRLRRSRSSQRHYARQGGLPKDPAFTAADPGVAWCGVGPVAREDIQHTEQAKHAVEPVLSGRIRTETVCRHAHKLWLGASVQ